MPYAIIRGRNGRRHEVDFGDAPVRVQISSSEETVEIFIEADFQALLEERRRFAILNVPRHQSSEATGAAARRAAQLRSESFGSPAVSDVDPSDLVEHHLIGGAVVEFGRARAPVRRRGRVPDQRQASNGVASI